MEKIDSPWPEILEIRLPLVLEPEKRTVQKQHLTLKRGQLGRWPAAAAHGLAEMLALVSSAFESHVHRDSFPAAAAATANAACDGSMGFTHVLQLDSMV